MFYCPVLPPRLAPRIRELTYTQNLGHFCYADVAYSNSEYADLFASLSVEGKGPVILDCPVMEKGKILKPKELRKVVEHIKPTVTIIPDVLFSKRETLKAFYEYCDLIDHPSLTGVLQGNNFAAMVECAHTMLQYVSKLAIPRISYRNSREPRSQIIIQVIKESSQKIDYWHLLGARWPYTDDQLCSRLELANSIDTAEPINASLSERPILKDSVARPANFLERQEISSQWLNYNVRQFQKLLVMKEA